MDSSRPIAQIPEFGRYRNRTGLRGVFGATQSGGSNRSSGEPEEVRPDARGRAAFLSLIRTFRETSSGVLALGDRPISEGVVPLVKTISRPPAKETPSERADIIAEKAKEIMAACVQRPITLAGIAREFYLSPHYVADMFKSSTGMTIKEYHERLRMQCAERWLAEPAMRSKEISERLGYASPEYFSARFRKFHGVSPRSFRRRLLSVSVL